MATDDADFWRLREAPLHRFGPDDWADYYPRMAAWLGHKDAEIRDAALERLCMAVFRAEPDFKHDSETERRSRRRAAWLIEEIEQARERHPDVLPAFLRQLRWHGDDEPFPDILLPWLDDLKARPRAGAPDDLVEGTIVLIGGFDWEDEAEPPAILDHPSNHVRACAAYLLGRTGMGDGKAFGADFLARLTAKELARPGIVGPFWSGWCLMDFRELDFDPLAWMLDIVERRSGPEPDDMPFNGVDFHIHQLADHSPDAVRRLIKAGRDDLALMAATETRDAVDGMAPILRELAAHSNPSIARSAQHYLARHHNEAHPGADPAHLRHLPGWRPGVDAFAIRQGDPQGEGGTWRDLAVFFPAPGRAPFDDAEAWAIIDAALPADLRGELVKHHLPGYGAEPAPVRLGDGEKRQYETGALVDFEGDPDARRWRRLEIIGRGLQDKWRPLDWTAPASEG